MMKVIFLTLALTVSSAFAQYFPYINFTGYPNQVVMYVSNPYTMPIQCSGWVRMNYYPLFYTQRFVSTPIILPGAFTYNYIYTGVNPYYYRLMSVGHSIFCRAVGY